MGKAAADCHRLMLMEQQQVKSLLGMVAMY